MTASDILRWFGETSLAVGALILLVLIIRKPFARLFGPRAAYALWLAPLLRLFLPKLAVLPAAPASESALVWLDMAVMPSVASLDPSAVSLWAIVAGAALFIWIAVAVAWLSVTLETQTRFLRAQLALSAPASAELTALAADVAETVGLKNPPQIRVANDFFGPAVVGLFRPALFLPVNFEKDYDLEERRLALAHELSHIARGDIAASLVAFAFQAAQWPNPLVHVAMRAFRTDQEAACDAFVLARCRWNENTASDYASAIVKSAAGAVSPACALTLGHPVKERLMLLKSTSKSPLHLFAGGVSAMALVVAGCAATANYGYATADGKEGAEARVEQSSTATSVIKADKGEALVIDGVKGAAKIEIREENGDRTVRIFDDKGELISENIYGPDEGLPFDDIIIKNKDGSERKIKVASLGGDARRMLFFGKGEGDEKNLAIAAVLGDLRMMDLVDGEDVTVFNAGGGEGKLIELHKMRLLGGASGLAFCTGDGDGETVMLDLTDEEGDEASKSVNRTVVCLSGADADPEKRAEALQKAIDHIEENAKKDEERRQKMIAALRKQLQELEAEKQ